jgi:hypothetical protein
MREPLVRTFDFVSLFGHRRFAACELLGMETIAGRSEGTASEDKAFLLMLRR